VTRNNFLGLNESIKIFFSINEEKRFFLVFFRCTLSKVIKEKWGQYFANYHFCTPLCSIRNGNLAIKIFLEQKFAKSSLINLDPNT